MGTDLRFAFFDSATNLERVEFGEEESGLVWIADVQWGGVNLSMVDWTRVNMVGDEYMACQAVTRAGETKERRKLLEDYRAAVRANRQLANAMRAQGMNEEAVPFAYRAQVLQRKVLWRQMLWGQVESLQPAMQPAGAWQRGKELLWRIQKFGASIFSWFLDVLAGYGYKPGRSLLVYLLVIAAFALCYYGLGQLAPREAFIFSVTSFHGRGFLPGPFALSSPITALAALEAIIGLFIEISFIATFTQRFFGR
jgi:hypothetical protein